MIKHRSFRIDKFFKSVDEQLRNQYFSKKSIIVPTGISLDNDSFDNFWNGIEEVKRVEIEEELHCINDTAEQARDCLEQSCRDFNIQKHENETSETTAMRVFLHDDEEAFILAFDAYLYYVLSEKLSHHKFPTVTLNFTDAQLAQFKKIIEQFFKNCGKSDHCAIRQRVDGEKTIFLIARGDFMKTHLIFDDTKGKPAVTSFRPAKEDMLVFDRSNNVLSMSICGRSDEEKKRYLEMFAGTFLGVAQIEESTLSNSLVVLDPIKNRSFNYGGNEHIEAVKLTEVNAKLNGGFLRIALKSNDLANIQGYGIGADGAAEFLSVKLKFLIKREGKKSKAMIVEIRPPENSKIPQKREKQIVEDYLREQGVLLV